MLAPRGLKTAFEVYMQVREAVTALAVPMPEAPPATVNSIEQSNVERRRTVEFERALTNALFHDCLYEHRAMLHVWRPGSAELRVMPQILALLDDEPSLDLRDRTPDELFSTVMGSVFAQAARYLFLDDSTWAVKVPTQDALAYRTWLLGQEDRDVDVVRDIAGYGLFLQKEVNCSGAWISERLPPAIATVTNHSHWEQRATSAQIMRATREIHTHLDQLKASDTVLPRKEALFRWHQEAFGIALHKRAQVKIWDRLKADFPELARPGRPRKPVEIPPPEM